MHYEKLGAWAGAAVFGLIVVWGCSDSITDLGRSDVVQPDGKGIGSEVLLLASEFCSDFSAEAIATFEDANLETAIRDDLGISSQADLTCGLVAGITTLEAGPCACGVVGSLVGIQNLTGLGELKLGGNQITDVGPLSGLTSLIRLELSGNTISDISPLRGLTALRHLELGSNEISDIGALSGLTLLTRLHLEVNSITDISALSGMTRLSWLQLFANAIVDISALRLTGLTWLQIYNNEIVDISALGGLTGLWWLDLGSNKITDITALQGLTGLQNLGLGVNFDLGNIQPLLDNTGIGVGDGVDLVRTEVSCTDVAALQAKGVTVTSDCS